MFSYSAPPAAPLAKRPLFVSVVFHVVALAILLTVRFSRDLPVLPFTAHEVTLVAPRLAPFVPKPRPALVAVPEPAPVVRAAPRTFLPPEQRVLPKAPEIELPKAPVIEVARVPQAVEMPKLAPSLPPPIKTGNIADARVAAPPTPAPSEAVKAAGFASTESLTQGPPRGTLAASGFGSAKVAGNNEPSGVIAKTTGFGNASNAGPAAAQGSITRGGFGEARVAAPDAPRERAAAQPAAMTAVEIVSKPKPEYTDEARRLKIEGEVTLQVLFSAAGEARVLRVVRGLGHGLDEAASAAARQIRFKPARRAGVAEDSTALVHIVFQLAY